MPYVEDDQSTAQTDTVWWRLRVPGNRLLCIDVSTDTAQNVTLESRTTGRRWKVYAAANSTTSTRAPNGRDLFRCADNASLTYTSSAAGNVFVAAQYAVKATSDLSS